MNSPPRPSPSQEVDRAKAALLAPPPRRSAATATNDNPLAEKIAQHPLAAVGFAAVAGFLIVVAKPGRMLIRQVLLAGTGVALRRALLRYIRS